MDSSARGFTLLEVLFALLILTTGLLGLAGTLAPTAALAREGKAHGRAAQLLANRFDSLRAELAAQAPACIPPGSGTAHHPGAFTESWSTSAGEGTVGVFIEAAFVDRRGLHADTLLSQLACP